ncbi:MULTISPECIES: CpaF family protein [unclassified Arthrobacter]|uniref:CpaF family protein n=1 Tax=unclassified Arthrobacter TaxID=235627 RepID=UPI0021062219|nr:MULTISPECIES: ATPase, T2SS/T4P/T4SS family [unclassified Arthrobacter]MCQ1945375.1 Flp pilus assembly complex ATPase component TadA [Arthrobacter sp. zg-Y1116]MCQ1994964.1 Flp pilus assembly complex ATPase component TadA [Arthrobacter sp. zg-Y1171]UWX83447.1 ATPase, T2SS/T4P/T4SS family [Arthrobacter sp. zg-Y1171]
MDAARIVEDEVRELIRVRGLDPQEQSAEVRRLVDAAVSDYDDRSLLGTLPPLGRPESVRRQVFDAVAGFGALQPLLDDPTVEEVWINSPSEVYVARDGRSELTSLTLTAEQVRLLVERMLKSSGRRLDLSSPFVDAALPDGSRLHVAIPDVTRRHWAVNIRKFVARARRLDHLVELGTLTPDAARFLGAAVAAGLNILVSGATQAGKTTMLNCLAAAIGPRERVVTVEEIFELQLPLRDVVGLQCRQPNLEGQGEIPLRRLVKEALRMRPDRLIVGEVREAESLDMLIALNAGLPGMCTIHANSARDAVTKLCTLPLLAGNNISSAFVVPTVASCIDLVVHCSRTGTGRREVTEILALGRRVEGGIIESSPVFGPVDGKLAVTASSMPSADKFALAGVNVAALLGAAA